MAPPEPNFFHWLRTDRSLPARALRRAGLSALGTYAAYFAYGALHRELARPAHLPDTLPGDELLRDATAQKDFVTTIRASRAEVFPWLLQMGWGRAGYYSWYPLDNGGVPSPSHVVPELQSLAVGDEIPDGPRAKEGLGTWKVRVLERDRALVLYTRREPFSGLELPESDPRPAFACSWAFVLDDAPGGCTRLVVRVRTRVDGMSMRSRALSKLVTPIFDVGDTVMEWTLVGGLRDRVESTVRA